MSVILKMKQRKHDSFIFLIYITTIYPSWLASPLKESQIISNKYRTFVKTYENYEHCSVQDLNQIDEEFV